MKWQVVVSNVGTVFDGDAEREARKTFNEYVRNAKAEHGRASGENVVLMFNDAIQREYVGRLHRGKTGE